MKKTDKEWESRMLEMFSYYDRPLNALEQTKDGQLYYMHTIDCDAIDLYTPVTPEQVRRLREEGLLFRELLLENPDAIRTIVSYEDLAKDENPIVSKGTLSDVNNQYPLEKWLPTINSHYSLNSD